MKLVKGAVEMFYPEESRTRPAAVACQRRMGIRSTYFTGFPSFSAGSNCHAFAADTIIRSFSERLLEWRRTCETWPRSSTRTSIQESPVTSPGFGSDGICNRRMLGGATFSSAAE